MKWPNGKETTKEEVIEAWQNGLITAKECNEILGFEYVEE